MERKGIHRRKARSRQQSWRFLRSLNTPQNTPGNCHEETSPTLPKSPFWCHNLERIAFEYFQSTFPPASTNSHPYRSSLLTQIAQGSTTPAKGQAKLLGRLYGSKITFETWDSRLQPSALHKKMVSPRMCPKENQHS